MRRVTGTILSARFIFCLLDESREWSTLIPSMQRVQTASLLERRMTRTARYR